MRLTDHTDYALRALMYLGTHREHLVTIDEIAATHEISRNHLAKVIYRLGLSRIIHTVRGRSGGVCLAMEPERISIGAVVRTTEPDFTMVECFDETTNRCRLSPVCSLKGALDRATRAYLAELDRISLADVLAAGGLPGTGAPA